jgi:hypothetical protein
MKNNDRQWKARHLLASLPPTLLGEGGKRGGGVLKVNLKNWHYLKKKLFKNFTMESVKFSGCSAWANFWQFPSIHVKRHAFFIKDKNGQF